MYFFLGSVGIVCGEITMGSNMELVKKGPCSPDTAEDEEEALKALVSGHTLPSIRLTGEKALL